MTKWITICLYLFTLALDLISTYYANPNLALEQNFIVSWFGLTWPYLITWNILMAAGIISFYHYALYLNKTINNTKITFKLILCLVGKSIIYTRIIIAFYLALTNTIKGAYLKKVININYIEITEKLVTIEQGYCILHFFEMIVFCFILIMFYKKLNSSFRISLVGKK